MFSGGQTLLLEYSVILFLLKKLCCAQVGSYSYHNQVWFGSQFLFNPILGFMHGLIIKNKWYICPSLKKSVSKFE